jgi:hypothetical protein
MMKTIKELISKSNIPEGLIRAVVRQSGDWEQFKESALDVVNHGADTGCNSGFIYYVDTVKFFTSHRDLIRQYATTMAEDAGMGVIEMIKKFRCLDNNYSTDEVAQTLYGPKSKEDSQIANALAWFALEEVARAYSDALEG